MWNDERYRVAVTGLGLVSPLGNCLPAHWDGLMQSRRAVRALSPQEAGFHSNLLPASLDGWNHWAAAPAAGIPLPAGPDVLNVMARSAATEAWNQSGLTAPTDSSQLESGAVVVGVSKPALPLGPVESRDAESDGWNELASPALHVASCFGFTGGALTPSVACATGLISIIRGMQMIRDGQVTHVLAGSTDWSIHPAYLAAYRRMGVMARPGDDPATACKPYDLNRQGFMVGSGAAMLVLEPMDSARSRGATILAELAGAGLTGDATSLVETDLSGDSPARAIHNALQQAHVDPDEIDVISLHGTGTRANDACETAALKQVFGSRAHRIPCFSLKGNIGHLMGAAGSVEAVTLIEALNRQIIPPTVNLQHPDPDCDLDYTPETPRPARLTTALKLSLGFGGACAAVVMRRVEN